MNKTAKKVVATILTTVMTVGAATVVSADDLSIRPWLEQNLQCSC